MEAVEFYWDYLRTDLEIVNWLEKIDKRPVDLAKLYLLMEEAAEKNMRGHPKLLQDQNPQLAEVHAQLARSLPKPLAQLRIPLFFTTLCRLWDSQKRWKEIKTSPLTKYWEIMVDASNTLSLTFEPKFRNLESGLKDYIPTAKSDRKLTLTWSSKVDTAEQVLAVMNAFVSRFESDFAPTSAPTMNIDFILAVEALGIASRYEEMKNQPGGFKQAFLASSPELINKILVGYAEDTQADHARRARGLKPIADLAKELDSFQKAARRRSAYVASMRDWLKGRSKTLPKIREY